uniref:Uncharacterized protein n=1 Tax=Steinernema glaseri TaxID=37863 RepID=A0A1I7Y6L7_9BILA
MPFWHALRPKHHSSFQGQHWERRFLVIHLPSLQRRVAPLRSGAQTLMSKKGSPPPVTASSAFASGAPHQLSTTEEEQETPGSTASTIEAKTVELLFSLWF